MRQMVLPLVDLFGWGRQRGSHLVGAVHQGIRYPAMRYRLTVHFDARLDGCTAHVPELARTVIVVAPPERLDGIELDWLRRS